MLRFIPSILAGTNIKVNKEYNPDLCLAHTQADTLKHRHGKKLKDLSLCCSHYLCAFYFGEKVQVKNERKHYINTLDLLYYP